MVFKSYGIDWLNNNNLPLYPSFFLISFCDNPHDETAPNPPNQTNTQVQSHSLFQPAKCIHMHA